MVKENITLQEAKKFTSVEEMQTEYKALSQDIG